MQVPDPHMSILSFSLTYTFVNKNIFECVQLLVGQFMVKIMNRENNLETTIICKLQ